MKKLGMIIVLAAYMMLPSAALRAAPAVETQPSPQFDEKLLREMAREERDRQLQELARSVSSLERKVTRLSDRLDRIEHDLKEVKRKVKAF